VRSPDDRRKINVYLTPKGRRLREPLLEAVANVHRTALAGISPAELERFLRKTLEKLRVNMERVSTERAAPKRKARSAA
jgi:DNA-binding MarR family transcriptional regulator